MNKARLIDKLDKATDRAVSVAVSKGYPLVISPKSTVVGISLVEKNQKGFYNVVTVGGNILYEDISVHDVAVIVAQRYNNGEFGVIRQVLALDNKYSKHRTDMINYLHCLKGAKSKNDFERMAILEDKFQVSEMLAKGIRDHISNFRRSK